MLVEAMYIDNLPRYVRVDNDKDLPFKADPLTVSFHMFPLPQDASSNELSAPNSNVPEDSSGDDPSLVHNTTSNRTEEDLGL